MKRKIEDYIGCIFAIAICVILVSFIAIIWSSNIDYITFFARLIGTAFVVSLVTGALIHVMDDSNAEYDDDENIGTVRWREDDPDCDKIVALISYSFCHEVNYYEVLFRSNGVYYDYSGEEVPFGAIEKWIKLD